MEKVLKFVKRYKFWLIGLAVIAGLAFGAYQFFFKPPSYDNFTVGRKNLTETVEISGKIDAEKLADLHFQAGGLLTYLPVHEGDAVKQYQTIAAMDQRQVKKTLDKYLNLYKVQRDTFDQTVSDYQNQQNSGASRELRDAAKRLIEQDQSKLNNTVLDVELQDLARQYSYLMAPFDGIITSMNVKSANVNVAITDIFRIVDPTTLYFKANIDESDISRVNIGQKVKIILDAFPEKEFDSEILKIAFAAKETSTGTAFEAKFSLPLDEIDNLKLGFNGTAEIILNEKPQVLTLPVQAVKQKGNNYYAIVKENGQYIDKQIETGIESDEYIEIMSGLAEGQDVYVLKKL